MGAILNGLIQAVRAYLGLIRFSVSGELRLVMWIWNRRWLWLWLPIGIFLLTFGLDLWGCLLGFLDHPVASRSLTGLATIPIVGLLLAWHLLLVGLAKWLKFNIDLVEKPIVEWGGTVGKDLIVALLKAAGLAVENLSLGKLSIVDQETMVKKVASTRQILIAAALVQATLFIIPGTVTFAMAFLAMLVIFSLILQIKEFGWDPTAGRLLLYRFSLFLGGVGIFAALTAVIFPATFGWILVGAGGVDRAVLAVVSHPTETVRKLGDWTDPVERIADLAIIGGVTLWLVAAWRLIRRIRRSDPRPLEVQYNEACGQKAVAQARGDKWGPRTRWVRALLVVTMMMAAVILGAAHLVRHRQDLSHWMRLEASKKERTEAHAGHQAAERQSPAPHHAHHAPASNARIAWVEANGAGTCPQLIRRSNWRSMHDPRAACRLEAGRSRFAWMSEAGGQ